MSTSAEEYPERLRADMRKLQASINTAVASAPVEQAAIDRIYALLYNTKVQGEVVRAVLVSSICAQACGILKRSRSPDQGTWRVVKAHIDALAIVIEYDVAGDGGPLGQRMVEELRGLARAVGA